MTDRNNEEPVSSEELLRRARDELTRPSNPDEPAAPDSTPHGSEAAAADPAAAMPPRPAAPPSDQTAPTVDGPLIPADFQPAAGGSGPPVNSDTPDAPVGTETAAPGEPGLGSQLWAKRGWIVGAVFLVILAFSYLGRGTSVEDLTAGDCFNDPGSEAISEVDTIDCTEPHDYEMFASVDLVGDDGAWPGDFELFEEADDACFEIFLTYTGISLDDDVFMWDYTTFIPEQESWEEGSRDALCTLFRVDADFSPIPATTSARAGG